MADEKKEEEPGAPAPGPAHEEPHGEGARPEEGAAAQAQPQAEPAVKPVVADAMPEPLPEAAAVGAAPGAIVADAAAQQPAGAVPPPPGPPPPLGAAEAVQVIDVDQHAPPAARNLVEGGGGIGGGGGGPTETAAAGGGHRGRPPSGTPFSQTALLWVTVSILIVLSSYFIWSIASDAGHLSSVEFSRGLITLLFSVGTIVTAVMLIFAAIYQPDSSGKDTLEARFNRGKEVLSLLIGIFGTILGFYFGTANEDSVRRRAITALEGVGGEVIDDTIYLDKPSIRDADLIHLRRLPKVKTLHLDFSGISDDGLIYLYDLKDLGLLTLRHTNVHREAVQSLIDSTKNVVGNPKLAVVPPVESFPTTQQGAAATPAPAPSPSQPLPQTAPAASARNATPAAGKPETAPPPEPVVPKTENRIDTKTEKNRLDE